MKLIRIVTMAIALCAVSASVAAAQRPDSAHNGGRRGGMMGGRLLVGIGLTDPQKAQHVTIREKYMPKLQELMMTARSTGAPPDGATRAQMVTLQAAYTAEIRATLTADQQKIFDKNVADERERRAKMVPPPGN